MKKSIYIASSWRNQHAVELLTTELRKLGFNVLSWVENNYNEPTNPINKLGFSSFEDWMKSYSASEAFVFDIVGAMDCDIFIYLSPGGKDAAVECGAAYASSLSKKNKEMIILHSKGEDFGLMRNIFRNTFFRYQDLLKYLYDKYEAFNKKYPQE